jgi:hypothetical protein
MMGLVMEFGELRPDRRLRIIFVVGIFVAVMCGLFPPYKIIEVKLIAVATPLIEAEYFCGYSFLLFAPSGCGNAIGTDGRTAYSVKIDITRLLIQWVLVALITGGLSLYIKLWDGEK